MLLSLIAALGSVSVSVSTPTPEGDMYVSLCSEDTFLSGACEHGQRRAASAEDVFVFEDVPAGQWAVQVWRDPEGDGEMRTMAFGIPAEPITISNDPPMNFGPPQFADAAVAVTDEGVQISLSVN
ncbi:DUF2141 domain-containing protein [Oceanicaulis sp.]|jgi:uncharacterized protein (DUF2141 family)|uniref:DUF2141 domain-containing protein n=1 Tax=Oceanicaulis sp. TaxID=1924941 RepID=UPI003F6EC373